MNAKPISLAVTGQALIETPLDLESSAGRPVREFFAGADLGFANFEACIQAPGAWPTKTKTLHAAPPDVLVSLRNLGVGAVGHANNHAFDLGPPGAATS